MPIEGQLTQNDYMAAQFLHLRPRPVFAVIGVILLALYAWALTQKPSFLLVGVGIYLAVYFTLLIPWQVRRTFRQYKALSELISVEIRDDGLFFKKPNSEGLFPWAHIIKWKRNKKLLLLYPADNLFYVLPSSFFPSQEAFNEFLRVMEEKAGKAR